MADSPSYPHLAQPLRVAGVTLRNRIVMGSMHTGLEGVDDAAGFDRMARFYGERAKGGVGLIVTGGYGPNAAGRLMAEDRAFETPAQAVLHRRVTQAVHQHAGVIILQIVHAGRYGYHRD